jgi:hypothetical protein
MFGATLLFGLAGPLAFALSARRDKMFGYLISAPLPRVAVMPTPPNGWGLPLCL